MSYVDRVIAETEEKNRNQPEFLQTVREVLNSLRPIVDRDPKYEKAGILERIVEPESPLSSGCPGWTTAARSR